MCYIYTYTYIYEILLHMGMLDIIEFSFYCNDFHNIFIVFDILDNCSFTTMQVKQSAIISNKHRIYEMPHELPIYLRLKILEN